MSKRFFSKEALEKKATCRLLEPILNAAANKLAAVCSKKVLRFLPFAVIALTVAIMAGLMQFAYTFGDLVGYAVTLFSATIGMFVITNLIIICFTALHRQG